MTLRAISEDMSPATVQRVDLLLKDIKDTHDVFIPWAIESGSRAWGFPSPDSDYDARFIYVRPACHALTIWPRRDVIETPIINDLDVNGWELAKALRLLLKGNAVVVEWLRSPIIYQGEAWFRDDLLAFARTWLDRRKVANHYLHLGGRQKTLHLDGSPDARLKKVFYALRPAVALRWMRLNPSETVPPMHLPTLVKESMTPPAIAALIAEMIERKVATREMGTGPIPPPLLAFMQAEFAQADDTVRHAERVSDEARREADLLFQKITRRLDGSR